MNHYPHHIGDFNTATRHLSRIERSVYRDMLDMYYDTESPLDGSDMAKLARRLCCTDEVEIAAFQYVLSEYFEQQDDGHWVHHRCEKELAAYRAQQVVNKANKKTDKTRQQRSREKRAAIFSALRAVGASVAYNAKMSELLDLCQQHGIDVASCVTGASHATVTDDTRNGHDTANQNQNQNQNQVNPPIPPVGGAINCAELVQTISLQFPEHRRTRLDEAEAEALALLQAGEPAHPFRSTQPIARNPRPSRPHRRGTPGPPITTPTGGLTHDWPRISIYDHRPAEAHQQGRRHDCRATGAAEP